MNSLSEDIKIEPGEYEELKNALYEDITPEIEFNFIRDHYGLKRGKAHMLLGSSGRGKSTLSRSILFQLASKKKVLLCSSEETMHDTKMLFVKSRFTNKLIDNIKFLHEEKMREIITSGRVDLFCEIIKNQIVETGAEIFYYDNITTSSFYDGMSHDHQVKFYIGLSDTIRALNIPFFFVAHTKKGFNDLDRSLMAVDDIRGSGTIGNKIEYAYSFLRLPTVDPNTGDDVEHVFIRVLKSRLLGNSGSIYLLRYDKDQNKYTEDKKISYSVFCEIFKERVQLK